MGKKDAGGKSGAAPKKGQQAKAPKQGGGGGKAKKKKWSKTKAKEKLQNMVTFDQATHDKLIADIPKLKMITHAIVCDKLHVNMSLARLGIKRLMANSSIRLVGDK